MASRIPTIRFTYLNHRGEVALRHARPLRIWYGASEWHPDEETFYLHCWDVDRKDDRHFRLDCMGPITVHYVERQVDDPHAHRTG